MAVQRSSGRGSGGRGPSPRRDADQGRREETYDYIVVGAGSAGCVVARRLVEGSGHRPSVLLLEAGGSGMGPSGKPVIGLDKPGRFFALQGGRYDWGYQTVKEPGLGGRSLNWPRGKVLGGSGAINSVVYMRGNRRNYNGWANAVGDLRWSFEEVLPDFLRSERNLRRGIEGTYHAVDGPMIVNDILKPNPASLAFVKAAREVGYDACEDFNGREQTVGAGLFQVNVDAGGHRVSSATAFLTPEIRDRLTVHTHAQVTRIHVRDHRAHCLDYDHAHEGRSVPRRAKARREVILCCGAIDTPKLLMLSGIGPREHLEQRGIDVVADLPAVGQHLQDHLWAGVVYSYREGTSSKIPWAGIAEAGLFEQVRETSRSPDLQLILAHAVPSPKPNLADPEAPGLDLSLFAIVCVLVKPHSSGWIRLRRSNPAGKPIIRANYLSDPSDLKVLVEGLKIARKIGQARAFRGLRGEEVAPGKAADNDEALGGYVRAASSTLFHPVGTCRMGRSAADSVVDSELRVHGIRNLRIADASIMPAITTGNTNAPCVMIGERAASLILGTSRPAHRPTTRTTTAQPTPLTTTPPTPRTTTSPTPRTTTSPTPRTTTPRPVRTGAAAETTAEALLLLLRSMGVEHFFANTGSDFPSIIDAYAKHGKAGDVPEPFLVPHESCAMSLAHGSYLASGKPPVVMVHSTVGTANATCGLINASRSGVPLVLMAGRPPWTESGHPASRDLIIHWGQESFDQGEMVRNFVKWDYELRSPAQLETVVRRAFAIAMTEPRGPVYLTLPREVLARPCRLGTSEPIEDPAGLTPVAPLQPNPEAVKSVARWLAEARRPLLITRSYGRRPEAVGDLVALAERFAVPVVEFQIAEHLNFPADHPLHLGYDFGDVTRPGQADPDTADRLKKADLILVVDCPMPWVPPRSPGERAIRDDAKVVHIGSDPIFSRYPIWGFPATLAIAANSGVTVREILRYAEDQGLDGDRERIRRRRARLATAHKARVEKWAQYAQSGKPGDTSSFEWVSHCVGQLLKHKGDEAVVVQEYDLQLPFVGFTRPGSYYGFAPSGGLGFGMGGALGVKLADREKVVIAVVGDGTYIFGSPSACHMVSAMRDLPVLWVVCNNAGWGYLALETMAVHPGGHAQSSGRFPLVGFHRPKGAPAARPWLAYEHVIRAFGGAALRVDERGELPRALSRAYEVVRGRGGAPGRQVLLNVNCEGHPLRF